MATKSEPRLVPYLQDTVPRAALELMRWDESERQAVYILGANLAADLAGSHWRAEVNLPAVLLPQNRQGALIVSLRKLLDDRSLIPP